MALWQKVIHLEIGNQILKTTEIFTALDGSIRRAWGTEGLQYWGDTDGNDIHVFYDKDSQVIEEMQFRIDLRNIDLNFINWIIDFARNWNLKFKIIKIEIYEPEISNIADILSSSNAEKFVTNPMKFLDDFENGLTKPN